MKQKNSFQKILPFVLWIVFLFLYTEASFADPMGNNGWHLNSWLQTYLNSDLVCKVQIISIRRGEAVKNNMFMQPSEVYRMIATSKVMSVIKGECPDVIEIEFDYPAEKGIDKGGVPISQVYTEL